MEITIIGWYGTETIGDRAILAGIFNIFSIVYENFNIKIGSLYPFYSNRTINEDRDFYMKIARNKLRDISVFNSLNPLELKRNIKKTDLLIVGGGPLMDLREMHILEYAFIYAKKKNIKSLIFGCGWGPLKKEEYIYSTLRLVDLADYVIFRDENSMQQCLSYNVSSCNKVKYSIDPAFFTCDYFIKNIRNKREEHHIAINLRDILLEGTNYCNNNRIEEYLVNIVYEIANHTELPIHLVPMHNFFIGGDDRIILNRISTRISRDNVVSLQRPLSLYDTMEEYYHAKCCVGMRFHSIVLQTILNGNNYIIDYTDPNTGKIIGMLRQLNLLEHYKERYISLHKDNNWLQLRFNIKDSNRYVYSPETICRYKNIYINCLKNL